MRGLLDLLMVTYTEPMTGVFVFPTPGLGEKCQGGCGREVEFPGRVFHIVPPASREPAGMLFEFGNRTFHSRGCLVTYLLTRTEPGYSAVASWATAKLPEAP